MNDLFGGPVVVSIPAQPNYVHVLRSVVAGVAARLDLSWDQIDDLRIIVDEVSAQLLRAGPALSITLEITPSRHRFELRAWSDAVAERWPPAAAEDSLAGKVLAALADEVRFERVDGSGPGLILAKSLEPVGRSGAGD